MKILQAKKISSLLKRFVISFITLVLVFHLSNVSVILAESSTSTPNDLSQVQEIIKQKQEEAARKAQEAEAKLNEFLTNYNNDNNNSSDSSQNTNNDTSQTNPGDSLSNPETGGNNADSTNSDTTSSDNTNPGNTNQDTTTPGSSGLSNTNNTNVNQTEQQITNSEGNTINTNVGCLNPNGCTEEKSIETNNQTGGLLDQSSPDSSGTGGTTTENSNTGEDSNTDSSAQEDTQADIINENETELNNTQQAVADSGSNSLEFGGKGTGEIKTGKATVEAENSNKANTNDISTGNTSGSIWPWMRLEDGSINWGTGEDSTNTAETEANRDLSIINKNKALINNEYDILGNSGKNKITAEYKFKEGGIETGPVKIKANILNLINTNIIDSKWWPLILDVTSDWTGDINLMKLLLDKFGKISTTTSYADPDFAKNISTGEDSFNLASTTVNESFLVNNENTGIIFNDLIIKGISGINKILSGYKINEAKLKTGPVDITTNLFNFLNTNLINSSWIVAVVNIFEDFAGNLILPSEGELFNRGNSSNEGASINVSGAGEDSINEALAIVTNDTRITSDNSAFVNTEIEAITNTGANSMYFSNKASSTAILTGKAKTQTNLLTLANRNIYGLSWFSGMFNMLGDWTGNILGLPTGALVKENGKNFVISADDYASGSDSSNREPAVQSTIENSGEDSYNKSKIEINRKIEINNKNSGQVVNKLKIEADSGSNDMAAVKAKEVKIETGPARVATNVANFVNTNMIAGKVLSLVVNVFGDWQGNVAFGAFSDLSVKLQPLIQNDDVLEPGDELAYDLGVANAEDGRASEAEVTLYYDPDKTEVKDAGGGEVSSQGQITWQVDKIIPGTSKTLKFKLKIKENLPLGKHLIDTKAKVKSKEPDRDEENNEDTSSITVDSEEDSPEETPKNPEENKEGEVSGALTSETSKGSSGGSGGSGGGSSRQAGPLIVSKYNEAPDKVYPGDNIIYHLGVKNMGSLPVRDVVVYDQLKNAETVAENSWQLQDILPYEEVVIDYEIGLTEKVFSGTYINSAYASGFNDRDQVIKSNEAESQIVVVGGKTFEEKEGTSKLEEKPSIIPEATTTTSKITREKKAEENLNEENEENEATPQIEEKPESIKIYRHTPIVQAAEENSLKKLEKDEIKKVVRKDQMVYGIEVLAQEKNEPESSFSFKWLFLLLGILVLGTAYYSYWEKQRQI